MKRVDQSSRSRQVGLERRTRKERNWPINSVILTVWARTRSVQDSVEREAHFGSNQSLLTELISSVFVLLLGDLAPDSLPQQIPPALFLRLVRSAGVISLPGPETLHRTELPLAGVRLEGLLALRARLVHSSLPSDSKKARCTRTEP